MNRKKGANGKNNANATSQDFYKYYLNTEKKPIPYSILKDLYKDLMSGLMELVLEGEDVIIPNLGTFSVRSYKPKQFDKNGNFIKPAIDFGRCWKYWRTKYPNLTDDEIVKLDNKPLLRYENRHSKGLKNMFYWDHSTMPIKGKQVYIFKPATQYNRKLSKIVKADTDIMFQSISI